MTAYYTQIQVAEKLGVVRGTVGALLMRGKLRYHGTGTYVTAESVQQYASTRRLRRKDIGAIERKNLCLIPGQHARVRAVAKRLRLNMVVCYQQAVEQWLTNNEKEN